MRIVLLALLAATVTAAAQNAEKNGQTESHRSLSDPVITGTPTPRPSVSPDQAVETFFKMLRAGDVDAAYDALVKGTIIADRPEDVTALKSRTKTALDSYGPVAGYETVDEKQVGSSLLRRTCVSLNSDLPLRWRFYFYKSEGAWRLVDLRVDDGLVELFEEAGRAKK